MSGYGISPNRTEVSLRERMEHYIDDVFPDADRFDIEEAIYWYASDYHSGQASELYRILSTSPFNPGPMSHGPEGMAEEIYNALVSEFG